MSNKAKYNINSNIANQYTNKSIEKQRDYYIAKHNDLIQKQTFEVSNETYSVEKRNFKSLSVLEQKIFLYIISKVKPNDKELKEISFDIQQFCKVVGIGYKGDNYENIKEAIAKLMSRVIILENRKSIVMINLLSRAKIEKNNGIISIKLHEELSPYILNLHNNYTQYSLKNVLAFKSKYSFILYEYLLSLQFDNRLNKVSLSVEELKKRMNCEKYTNFTNFVKYALEPAIKEINLYSDLEVNVNLVKVGRTYKYIEFYVKQLKIEYEEKEMIKRTSRTDKKLEPNRQTMYEYYYDEELDNE